VFGSSSVFFFGFSSSVKRSLFFVCDTTDRNDDNDKGNDEGDNDGDNDGNEDDKTSVDNRLDTVDGVDGDIDNFVEEVFFFHLSKLTTYHVYFFWGCQRYCRCLPWFDVESKDELWLQQWR
jgi:hypothetical protein